MSNRTNTKDPLIHARSRRPRVGAAACVAALGLASCSEPVGGTMAPLPYASEPALQATALDVRYEASIDSVVFEMRTAGNAGVVAPAAVGQLDGAPVLGYVFLTDLASTDVGFDAVEGTVALAVTSHPDFDDTPLWDEDGNAAYDDDGVVYHAHWVVLVEDARAPGELAVRQESADTILPPTAPMNMYLDSPGFTVIEDGFAIRVVVPADRMARKLATAVGGVTAYMEVDASGEAPLLALHGLISAIDEGAVSTAINGADGALSVGWPTRTTMTPEAMLPAFDVVTSDARYMSSVDSFVLSLDVAGAAATIQPTALGQTDGAPVLGYVFPTSIAPDTVGFQDIDGTLALAVTSHPDFDDTPLWDETGDADYGNDGEQYHVHWVVLVDDGASTAGLSVPSQANADMLPPTAPMPMYLDSPGYHAFAQAGRVSVVVPGWQLPGVETFSYDALTARMVVDASGPKPVLRVQQVYDVLSGDLSLPFTASRVEETP